MSQQHISALQIPLYKLHYLAAISDEPFTEQELAQFERDYSTQESTEIIDALRWAEKHPDFHFSSLAPGTRFSDQECHRYLANILRQIQKSQDLD